MIDYEAKWRNAVEENTWLTEQVERLRGNKRENPTLRDQFAMIALPAVIEKYKVTFDEAAAHAYSFADAMIRHRHKPCD
jgi:hypothetical protein